MSYIPRGVIEVETPKRSYTQDLLVEPPEGLLSGQNIPEATVSTSVGYGMGYGAGKVSCMVILKCDQTLEMIQRANEVALGIARAHALDAMELIAVDLETLNGQPKGLNDKR